MGGLWLPIPSLKGPPAGPPRSPRLNLRTPLAPHAPPGSTSVPRPPGSTSTPRCRSPGAMSVESVLARVGAIEQAISNPASLMAASTRTGGTAAPAEAAAEPTAPTSGNPRSRKFCRARVRHGGEHGPGHADRGDRKRERSGRVRGGARAPPGSGGHNGEPGPGSARARLGSERHHSEHGQPTLAPVSGTAGTTGSVGQRIVAIAESQMGQTEQPPGSNESPAIAAYRTATAGAVPGGALVRVLRLLGRPPGGRAAWRERRRAGVGGADLVVGAEHRSRDSQRTQRHAPARRLDRLRRRARGDRQGRARQRRTSQTIEGNYENKVSANVRTPTEATGYVNMN